MAVDFLQVTLTLTFESIPPIISTILHSSFQSLVASWEIKRNQQDLQVTQPKKESQTDKTQLPFIEILKLKQKQIWKKHFEKKYDPVFQIRRSVCLNMHDSIL